MKYTQTRITKEVCQAVSEQLGHRVEDIKLEQTLVNDLGADSLDAIELVMVAEDEFGIDFTDDEANAVTTVGGFIAMCTEKVQQAGRLVEEVQHDNA